MFTTIESFKRFAKELKDIAGTPEPLSLSTCQNLTAKTFGYRDWHDLHTRIEKGVFLGKAANGKVLGSILYDLGSNVDGTEIVSALIRERTFRGGKATKLANEFSVIETQYVAEVRRLVKSCPVGKFVVVSGSDGMGKRSAVSGSLTRPNSLTGLPANNLVCWYDSPSPLNIEVLHTFAEMVSGKSLPWPMTAIKVEHELLTAFGTVQPAAFVVKRYALREALSCKEQRSEWERFARIIASSNCPWIFIDETREFSDDGSKLLIAMAEVPAIQSLFAGQICSVPVSLSEDSRALVRHFEFRHFGTSSNVWDDDALLAKFLNACWDLSPMSMNLAIERMANTKVTQEGKAGWIERIEAEAKRVAVKRASFAEVKQYDPPESVAFPKFEPFPLRALFEPLHVRQSGRHEGSRFFFSINGLPVKMVMDDQERDECSIQFWADIESPTDAGAIVRDGIVAWSEEGSHYLCQFSFSKSKLGLPPRFCHSSFFEVIEGISKPILESLVPRDTELLNGSMSELMVCLQAIQAASGAQCVLLETATPTLPPEFIIDRGIVGGFWPEDSRLLLRKQLVEAFNPVGWSWSEDGMDIVAANVIMTETFEGRKRKSTEEVELMVAGLPDRLSTLKSLIVDLAVMPVTTRF
ncbi:hypothetical protein PbB2_02753 [Candidatus Phycosocius bacilliformis]|uniref:Uncharacterized protein n=1 Tax=Candidatus Phycosocius bacilliformis TaxID=1445552 RepID=A0A2P2EDE8_9PROT|nr:hypothetical protein [Candidatus Phycosocius bacilliformis]GBF59061.1 hypothetical protein PbB2_02753 [Candidatus Phycosocius bacilliformis]